MSSLLVDHQRTTSLSLRRVLGILFGVGTQLLFLWTVIQLFLFLRYGGVEEFRYGLWMDVLLAIVFCLPHSLLLVPQVQKFVKGWLPSGLMGCLHCSVTCLTLLFLIQNWGRHSLTLWKATGYEEALILAGFYASWVALFYSLYLAGMGYQTGVTQWWYWLKRQSPPKRLFIERGAYRWMRHPIYMSFLGLIWFTPEMTLDHAVLTAIWTVYIYVGSYAKDQRMLLYLGDEYREYATRVPGLPFIGFGPLLRMK